VCVFIREVASRIIQNSKEKEKFIREWDTAWALKFFNF